MPESFDRLIPYVGRALGCTDEELLQQFRPAAPADVPGILALRRAVTPDMWWDDEAYIRWRYASRPAPDGRLPYWVFVSNGEVLGACGTEPVTLAIDGRSADAVRTLDIMVRPDLEGLGLGAFMNLVLFRKFAVTIVTGSNESSHRLLSRMFHHAADLVFWKALVASHDVIGERFHSGPLTGIMAAGVDLLRRVVSWRRDVRPAPGVHVAELFRFDERATALSARCELRGRVLVRRCAGYLNWRFVDNPRCRYVTFGAFKDDSLEAYVVARLNLARPNPRLEGEIVDWLAAGDLADRHANLRALIAAALDELARRGARLVTCAAHGTGVEAAAEANGFAFREGQHIPFFVRAASARVHERLACEPGWYLTRGDLDVE
jgi:hypothetical protein